MKVYLYDKCGTCRNASKFLADRGIPHTAVPIATQPPTEAELEKMLAAYDGNLRRLFNTSGLVYKAMNLKDRLAGMDKEEAFKLLRGNGMLVKRPFVIASKGCLVGFDEKKWAAAFAGD